MRIVARLHEGQESTPDPDDQRPTLLRRAMQTTRARQQTKEFKEQYKTHADIEGTISQGVRAVDLRYARYRGLAKTKLQHFATAAGLNLLRLRDWWFEQPKAKTRVSPFLALAPQPG